MWGTDIPDTYLAAYAVVSATLAALATPPPTVPGAQALSE
jgi:hypothetical protein